MPSPGAASVDSAEREKAASEVAMGFLNQMGAAMRREIRKGGPTEAIGVCAELAPEVSGRLSRGPGWRVCAVYCLGCRMPSNAATGYKAGEFRGPVSINQPIEQGAE